MLLFADPTAFGVLFLKYLANICHWPLQNSGAALSGLYLAIGMVWKENRL